MESEGVRWIMLLRVRLRFASFRFALPPFRFVKLRFARDRREDFTIDSLLFSLRVLRANLRISRDEVELKLEQEKSRRSMFRAPRL